MNTRTYKSPSCKLATLYGEINMYYVGPFGVAHLCLPHNFCVYVYAYFLKLLQKTYSSDFKDYFA